MRFGFWYEVYAWHGKPEDERIRFVKLMTSSKQFYSQDSDKTYGIVLAKTDEDAKEFIWKHGFLEEIIATVDKTFSLGPLSAYVIRQTLEKDIDFLIKEPNTKSNEISFHIRLALDMLMSHKLV